MKVIFMGTPDFSVGTLEALVEAGHEVVLAVTQPDKPKGRGKEMQFTPVKECALAKNIPVYQPKRVREPECIEELRKYQADIMVVNQYHSNWLTPKQVKLNRMFLSMWTYILAVKYIKLLIFPLNPTV